MKNVNEILKTFGVELSEEQQADLNKQVAENYKTVAEFDKKVTKLESERDQFKEQLNTANEALKGFEGVNVEEINQKLADYQKQVEDVKNEYAGKLYEREFNDVLTQELSGYKFSSKSAEKAVKEQILARKLPMENGKILGLSDLVESIKGTDPDAFASEQTPPAKFTAPLSGTPTPKKMTRAEIMAIKDTRERQKAIAENMELFT